MVIYEIIFNSRLFVFAFRCLQKRSMTFLNKEITLYPNKEVRLGNNETFKLEAVEINDSRCPEGVTCIWQGFASVAIKATYQDKNSININLCLGACNTIGKSSEQVINVKGATYKVSLLEIEKEENLKAVIKISKL